MSGEGGAGSLPTPPKPYGAPRYAKMRRHLVEGTFVVVVVTAALWWSARNLVSSGDAAPTLAGATWSGQPFRLSDRFPGPGESGPRTLVYFYAPWCGVCKVSASNAATAARWLGGERLKVVAVALDYETRDSAIAFAAERELTTAPGVEVVLGDESTRQAWRIEAFPTYYVLDARGRIRYGSVGYSTLPGMVVRAIF